MTGRQRLRNHRLGRMSRRRKAWGAGMGFRPLSRPARAWIIDQTERERARERRGRATAVTTCREYTIVHMSERSRTMTRHDGLWAQ